MSRFEQFGVDSDPMFSGREAEDALVVGVFKFFLYSALFLAGTVVVVVGGIWIGKSLT